MKYRILSFLLLVCTTYSQEGPMMTKRSALRGAHCLPCEGGVSPLTSEQVAEFMIDYPEWQLLEGPPSKIERTFTFKDFVAAMKFVNTVADVAEKEGHHPDITIVYNKVTMQLFTHAIQGLSTNDFIIADLIDDIFQEQ